MPKTIGNPQKALIHVAKKQLGLTEDEYRAALGRVGVTTSKDLTFPRYSELLDHFKECGFTPVPKKSSGQTWRNRKQADAKEPLLGKIGAILLDLNLPWAYADSLSLKMFGIERCLWLAPWQLHKMVATLTYHQRRHANAK